MEYLLSKMDWEGMGGGGGGTRWGQENGGRMEGEQHSGRRPVCTTLMVKLQVASSAQ